MGVVNVTTKILQLRFSYGTVLIVSSTPLLSLKFSASGLERIYLKIKLLLSLYFFMRSKHRIEKLTVLVIYVLF